MDRYVHFYDVHLLDDLHNFFPALLYDQQQFNSVPDVFRYVNQQMDRQFNTFNRGQREYNQTHPRIAPRRVVTRAPPTTSPLYTTLRLSSLGGLGSLGDLGDMDSRIANSSLSEYIASLLQIPMEGVPVGTRAAMEPVVVAPTQAQIDSATTLRAALVADEQSACSICQESYTDGQAVRTITHCSHKFHKNCIDTWFSRNVHCPDCRHDIRST
jgi:hypothetical protein